MFIDTVWLVIFTRIYFHVFASQGPFMKIKTAEFFVVHMQNNKLRFNLSYLELAANRSESVSVPLTAIVEAIGNKSAM